MDGPDLDRVSHVLALGALARVNRISFAARRVLSEVERLHRNGRDTVRVLDVACGGGDVLHQIARYARRRRLRVELAGCDVSPVALEEARRAVSDGSAVRFFELDVHRDRLPEGYDLVCSSLFLHHLSEEEAILLLRGMAAATRSALLVQDLRRTRLGYALAYAGLHLLTRSDVARSDGLTSVEGAFSIQEVTRLCELAGLERAEVRGCWPQRYTIRWCR
jgi:SAM-dependent methyltransferase